MELRQIVYFLKVAEHKSFSQAAELLYVSQPAITVAIKKLETELGIDLLERKNVGISLTTAGEVFYTHAQRIMDDVAAAERQIELLKQEKKTICIGAPGIAGSEYYPLIYQYFQENNPDIMVRILDLRSPEVVRQVCAEEIALGIAILPKTIPQSLYAEPLKEARVQVMLPADHPLREKEVLSLEELAPEKAFFCSSHTYTHERMQDAFNRQGLHLRVDDSFDDNQTIVNMVSRGFGIYYFPDTDSTAITRNPDIVIRKLDVDISYQVGLLYKRSGWLSEPARRLIDYLKRVSPMTVVQG